MISVRLAFVVLAALAISGCSFNFDWFSYLRGRRAMVQRDYPAAISIFHELMLRQPDSARALSSSRQGARLAHLETKNYPQAVEFYKHIILRSQDPLERKSAQRYVAQIYFENIQDYERAVIEYEKLLKLIESPSEAFRYRLNLAKAHLQLNNLDQAANELDVILSQKLDEDEIFEAKILKGNILVSAHKLPEAAVVWQEILKEFPERSKKENVALNLVVCYEEMKDFEKAIEALEQMRADYPNPQFLNDRISRLRERKSNQPGAQGWRR
ncbi:MAG: tetratricopeptide repeat protein [Bdellovibrionales bacterium]|nr:tetratricopeptide repeat protein [Bdellovibrionales bacterium]